MEATDDARLLALAKRAFAGDRDAWREFFTEIEPIAFECALRRTRNVEAAREVSQEALLKLMRSRVPPNTRVDGWIMSAVTSVVFDSTKKRKRTPQPSEEASDPECVIARKDSDPAEETSFAETRVVFRRELLARGVSPEAVEAMEKRYFDGKTLKKSAEELHINYAKLRQQVHRCARVFNEVLRLLGIDV